MGWRACHPGHRGHPWGWHPWGRTFGAMSSIWAHGSKRRGHPRGHRGPGWNMHGHTVGWSWWGTHRRFSTRRNERRGTRHRGHVVRTSRRTCRGINKVTDIFNIFLFLLNYQRLVEDRTLNATHGTQQKRVYLCFLLGIQVFRETNKQQQQMNQQKLDKRFAVKLLNGHF